MIGKLVIEKSSENISYFLYAIKIIGDNGGKVSRDKFVQEMANFKNESEKSDKESREMYNKSKLPRYYGFVDLLCDNGEKFLVLTNRGRILLNNIEDKGDSELPEYRYRIKKGFENGFRDIIIESLVFDSFGKNNCGVETSKTDVEPPKILFKVLLELGRATAEEISYAIYGLNNQYFKSFEEAIESIKSNRKNGINYDKFLEDCRIVNKTKDFKFANVFTNENINLISKEKFNGRTYYSLSDKVNESYRKKIGKIDAIYKPIRLYAYSYDDIKTLKNWIYQTVLGRVGDNSLIFNYKECSEDVLCFDYSSQKDFIPGLFEKALFKAFREKNKNIYLIIEGLSEVELIQRLGSLSKLLRYTDDLSEENHGWSVNSIENEQLYNYLVTSGSKKDGKVKKEIKDHLVDKSKNNLVVLPSNIHIVGMMTMNKNNKQVDYDYRFNKCLVNIKDDDNKTSIDENLMKYNKREKNKLKNCFEIKRQSRKNKVNPLNLIVYGAPGTGKTYSMVEYALAIIDGVSIDDFRKDNTDRKSNVSRYKELVKAGQVVFTTFHQNYGYEDFIQGLRPDNDSETMAFKTVDGVFKVIADTALNDAENKNYVIIIDEINRANISKVFGELITLIEEDKRWGELDEMSATLQSGDQFAIPNNLYIVGTMNSADKSISLIDAALRRRFDFIEQKPDSTLVPEGVLRNIFNNINKNLVRELDSTDLLIGHSYFMNKKEADLCNILNHNIIPLLYEYFYDNRKKVAKLLKDAIGESGARVEIVDEKVGRLRVKDKVE